MTKKEQIIQLREQGKSYKQIVVILRCSISLVSYYCGLGQKEKTQNRTRRLRAKHHPFQKKMECFIYRQSKQKNNKQIIKSDLKKQFRDKIYDFKKRNKNMKQNFTIEDIINKFGNNPKCYLTGEEIDIYKPSSYEFDHIIPVSRGGDNSLDNLQIAIKKANQSKRDMTPDELIFFCKKVLEYHDYEVKRNVRESDPQTIHHSP